MPLSKRINNLHINSFSGMQENSGENMETDWGNRNFMPSPNYSEPSQGSPLYDGYSSSQSSYTAEYRPNLDTTENPFYYESNKLLFSLYMERIQRTTDLYWYLYFLIWITLLLSILWTLFRHSYSIYFLSTLSWIRWREYSLKNHWQMTKQLHLWLIQYCCTDLLYM